MGVKQGWRQDSCESFAVQHDVNEMSDLDTVFGFDQCVWNLFIIITMYHDVYTYFLDVLDR